MQPVEQMISRKIEVHTTSANRGWHTKAVNEYETTKDQPNPRITYGAGTSWKPGEQQTACVYKQQK